VTKFPSQNELNFLHKMSFMLQNSSSRGFVPTKFLHVGAQ